MRIIWYIKFDLVKSWLESDACIGGYDYQSSLPLYNTKRPQFYPYAVL